MSEDNAPPCTVREGASCAGKCNLRHPSVIMPGPSPLPRSAVVGRQQEPETADGPAMFHRYMRHGELCAGVHFLLGRRYDVDDEVCVQLVLALACEEPAQIVDGEYNMRGRRSLMAPLFYLPVQACRRSTIA